ncbi:LOW QUALITY PROTEIN: hypothetical protein U9M48_026294 [Paspalum notatum var. saurae]|uniref:Uncharacterized protein n=1 Tax=Paspalum notatum var. saurae TaxID=547442 RepID=A0AAQ3WYM9_PASNO
MAGCAGSRGRHCFRLLWMEGGSLLVSSAWKWKATLARRVSSAWMATLARRGSWILARRVSSAWMASLARRGSSIQASRESSAWCREYPAGMLMILVVNRRARESSAWTVILLACQEFPAGTLILVVCRRREPSAWTVILLVCRRRDPSARMAIPVRPLASSSPVCLEPWANAAARRRRGAQRVVLPKVGRTAPIRRKAAGSRMAGHRGMARRKAAGSRMADHRGMARMKAAGSRMAGHRGMARMKAAGSRMADHRGMARRKAALRAWGCCRPWAAAPERKSFLAGRGAAASWSSSLAATGVTLSSLAATGVTASSLSSLAGMGMSSPAVRVDGDPRGGALGGRALRGRAGDAVPPSVGGGGGACGARGEEVVLVGEVPERPLQPAHRRGHGPPEQVARHVELLDGGHPGDGPRERALEVVAADVEHSHHPEQAHLRRDAPAELVVDEHDLIQRVRHPPDGGRDAAAEAVVREHDDGGGGVAQVGRDGAGEAVVVEDDGVERAVEERGWDGALEVVEAEVPERGEGEDDGGEGTDEAVVAEVELVEEAEVEEGVGQHAAEAVGVEVEQGEVGEAAGQVGGEVARDVGVVEVDAGDRQGAVGRVRRAEDALTLGPAQLEVKLNGSEKMAVRFQACSAAYAACSRGLVGWEDAGGGDRARERAAAKRASARRRWWWWWRRRRPPPPVPVVEARGAGIAALAARVAEVRVLVGVGVGARGSGVWEDWRSELVK